MHKQECHPDRLLGGLWTAMSPSILPVCASQALGPALQGGGPAKGAEEGRGHCCSLS